MSVINQMLKDLDSRRGQPAGAPLAGLLSIGGGREAAGGATQAVRWLVLLAAAAGIAVLMWQNGRQPVRPGFPATGTNVSQSPAAKEAIPAAAESEPAPAHRIREIAWERSGDDALELVFTLGGMPATAVRHEKHDGGELEYVFPSAQLEAGLPMLAGDNRYYERYRLARRGGDVRLYLTPKDDVTVSAGPADSGGGQVWIVRAQRPSSPSPKSSAPAENAPAVKTSPPQTRTAVVRETPGEKSPPPADPVRKPADPRHVAEENYRRALDYLRADRVPPAVAELNKALSARPAFHAARELLASLYLQTGRDTEAHLLLRDGIALDRSYLNFPKLSARALIERGRLQEAHKVLSDSAPGAPADAEYQALHAAVAQRLGRHEEAAGFYMQALEREPERGAWWLGLGISLEALGRDREAVEAYTAAGRSRQLGAEVAAYVQQRLKALGGG